jgi:LysR family glycine cleavage system transcriptional activator
VSARLADGSGPPIDPLAPEGLLLLGDQGSGKWRGVVEWEEYAARLSRTLDPTLPRTDFDRADVMLQAAIGGLGIALGRTLLIEDDIRNGLLAKVGPPARIDACYWLVTSHEQAGTERIAALIRWLKRMLAATMPAG